jgi:hypothetical protein
MGARMSAVMLQAAQSTPRNRAFWIGSTMSALVIAFMLVDAIMKLLALPVVLEAGNELGFTGPAMARGLGAVLLVAVVLYISPRTAVLGAILLTGYLGGAIATHIRVGNPLFTHVLFGAYLGLLLWGGLYLRDVRLRKLIPARATA